MSILEIVGSVLMVLGAVFLALGGFGVFRMPDVFNRIQAGTKATTLGSFSLILGVGFMNPAWLPKVALIIAFIAITNPVGSSALARAAYKKGVTAYTKHTEDIGKEGEESGNA